MDYIELYCRFENTEEWSEIVVAKLAEAGFEMFEDAEDGLKAYIPAKQMVNSAEPVLLELKDLGINIDSTQQFIQSQNWNEIWESNFPSLVIADRIYVRASFHQPEPAYPFQIIIDPKMAFGTGHHATTALVMEQMLNLDFKLREVLDMGCGTGILAVLAEQLGAKHVLAIDHDPVCVTNAFENVLLNDCKCIEVECGEAVNIAGRKFDCVIANINRNIILNDLAFYVKAMNENSMLVLSGFYEGDIPMIEQKALAFGLKKGAVSVKDHWSCLMYSN